MDRILTDHERKRTTNEICLTIENKIDTITRLLQTFTISGAALPFFKPDPLHVITDSEEIYLQSSNAAMFAKHLVIKIFSKEERLGHNCTGKVFVKDGKNLKKPLNPEKLKYVKELVPKKNSDVRPKESRHLAIMHY